MHTKKIDIFKHDSHFSIGLLFICVTYIILRLFNCSNNVLNRLGIVGIRIIFSFNARYKRKPKSNNIVERDMVNVWVLTHSQIKNSVFHYFHIVIRLVWNSTISFWWWHEQKKIKSNQKKQIYTWNVCK